ncbi:MAG TPA: FAD/NAD(P)-binding oxidoreductase, partial [Vicinamibacteria bacterium]|nr:FAD/NAD(P)-binding oxidoreductase [Vicinamibacteria bacterium]
MAEVQQVEVAVVGAGPAGVAAASRAAEAGARVLVLDEAPAVGGQIWRSSPGGQDPPIAARRWLERLRVSGARVRPGFVVVDAPEPHSLLAASSDGATLRVQAGALVIATGARERFLPFPGWTLPGVLGAGGAQALLKSGASFGGLRVAVAGSGPLLLPVAAALRRGGAKLVTVVEQAPAARLLRLAASLLRQPRKLRDALAYRLAFPTTAYRVGTWVTAAHGDDRLEAITLSDGTRAPCDVLAIGYGLTPNLELPSLIGCSIEKDGVRVGETQETSVPDVYAAGEITGIAGVDQALLEGQIAGLAAAGRAEAARPLFAARARCLSFAHSLAVAFALRPELKRLAPPDTIVCRCEDVPLDRLNPGWDPRQAKLATRCGMGACQGRVCGSALEFLLGWSAD